MNTLDKLTALKDGDTGPALAGTKYEYVNSRILKEKIDAEEALQDDAERNAAICAVQREVIAELELALKLAREYMLNHPSRLHEGYKEDLANVKQALDIAKQLEDL